MADCAILHAGTGGSTVVTTAWLGIGQRAVFGYCDGGEKARFYIPLGALSVRAVIEKTGTRSWDYWGNNNTHYWRTENTYSVRVTGWRRDAFPCSFRGPVRMGTVESAEPAYLSGLTVRLYMPLLEQLAGHLGAEEGNAAYALMMRQRSSLRTTGNRSDYEIPCPAALLVEVPTGTGGVPAFVGAAALWMVVGANSLELTRDETVFDGTMKTTTDLYIEGGGSTVGGEDNW